MVESSAVRLDSVFHALADPTRRAILHGLTKGERTVTEIAQPHRMTLAAVSKHLKVLESAELIARERRGSFHIVRLQAQSLKAAEEWIAFYSRFWNQNLDNLEKFLEEKPLTEKGEKLIEPQSPLRPTALHIHVTRFLRAPRERVFAAWTDAGQMKQMEGSGKLHLH